MKTQAELNKIEVIVDYDDDYGVVRGFFMLSALNRMREFNFELAFDHLRTRIDDKLIEHAQNCTIEEFIDYNDLNGFYGHVDFNAMTISSDYMHVSEEEVKEALFGLYYEKAKEAFSGMFDDVIEIQNGLNNASYETEDECANVILFDRIIHAQHVTGDIYEDISIDDIKADLDEELIEIMEIELA